MFPGRYSIGIVLFAVLSTTLVHSLNIEARNANIILFFKILALPTLPSFTFPAVADDGQIREDVYSLIKFEGEYNSAIESCSKLQEREQGTLEVEVIDLEVHGTRIIEEPFSISLSAGKDLTKLSSMSNFTALSGHYLDAGKGFLNAYKEILPFAILEI